MSDQFSESDWQGERSSPLTHRVAEGVTELIHSGDLRDGERLPPIRELARRYETSFATARVAVERLEKEQEGVRQRLQKLIESLEAAEASK